MNENYSIYSEKEKAFVRKVEKAVGGKLTSGERTTALGFYAAKRGCKTAALAILEERNA
jgi:hypothetical protein